MSQKTSFFFIIADSHEGKTNCDFSRSLLSASKDKSASAPK